MPEEEPNIIETVKGKVGGDPVFHPVDDKGKPILPTADPNPAAYNNDGKPPPKLPIGTIVDIKA